MKWELPTSYKEWVEGLLSPFLPSVWLTDMNWNPREKCSLPSRTSMIAPCPAQYPLCLLCSPAAWYPTSWMHCTSPFCTAFAWRLPLPRVPSSSLSQLTPSFGALFRHSLPQEPTRFLTRMPFWSLSPLSILGCLCLALTKSCLGQSDLRWSLFPPDSNLICHPWHPQPQSPTWQSARPRLETSDRARDFWSPPRHPHLSLCSTEGSWLKISEGWERGGDKHRDTQRPPSWTTCSLPGTIHRCWGSERSGDCFVAHLHTEICVWGPGLPHFKLFSKSWGPWGRGCWCKLRPGSLLCQQLRTGAELWVSELVIRSVRICVCVCVCV